MGLRLGLGFLLRCGEGGGGGGVGGGSGGIVGGAGLGGGGAGHGYRLLARLLACLFEFPFFGEVGSMVRRCEGWIGMVGVEWKGSEIDRFDCLE